MEIELSIRFIGDSLDVAAVTALIGRQPDIGLSKGQQVPVGKSDKKAVTQPTGVWSLHSPLGRTASLSDHTDWCLEQLEAMPIDGLANLGVAAIDAFYGVFGKDLGNFGFSLTPDQMRRFAELGVKVDFDCYP